ncbi:hypothetical protein HRE53_17155 [Acaryochloris sp. 'Moss Beach']|uniref:DUF5895 domain-containing protein n=1 Tax=Acaryochloris TaxID=155977 RepID=UPI001BAF881B|nr:MULTISPECIES: DUF5895 domain-containing protein [Acaryochloris]QUY43461.1 hypothetical protein I1H34_04795 [Acaryochloris marina S15]UJB68281.1 hypothetical protein HRE53_17155 [Acaryochloris sp. 'Moss Beach']
MMSATLTQPAQIDEFAGDEYGPAYQPLPYLQILNHEDPQQAGFFISADNAAAVGFQPTPEWQSHDAYFMSGGVAVGYRSLTARLAVLRRSPLLMFSRKDRAFLGSFDRDNYNPEEVILKTRYLVYLVSRQKQLLHQSPLQFTAKGSLCGSFGEHFNQFHSQMNWAYGKPRGDRFFALSILAVKLQPILKGQEKKSWVCSIVEHGQPTNENWRNFFLGYDPSIKQKLIADFEAHENFAQGDRVQSDLDKGMSERYDPVVDDLAF